jgi:hypothetical protein
MVARRNGDTPYDPAEEKPPIRQCRLSQPCAAYDGCRCRIYSERPQHCRNFDCALLAQLRAGNVQRRTALSKIRLARRLVQQVINSLRQFGDTDEHLALATRFRRTSQRLEAVGLEKALASRYGELTLAFHDLSLVLSTSFYPGPVR